MTADRDRAEWLAWRRQGIGASDVAAIVGLSPWASPYSVWAEKTGRTVDLDGDSAVQEFGRYAEAMIGPWFQDRTGYVLRQFQHRAEMASWPVARCTADALVRRPRSRTTLGVAEFKSTDWQSDWEEIPAQYQCQVQWQMMVCDVGQAWVPTLHGRRLSIYHAERDEEDVQFLLGEVRRFWTEHVEADVPPPADAHPATTAALGRIPRDPDAIADLDDHRDLLTAYAAAKRQAGAAKAELAGLANEIRAALGEAEVGHVAGVPVVLYPLRTRKPYTVEGGTYRSLTVRWKDPNP